MHALASIADARVLLMLIDLKRIAWFTPGSITANRE